VRDYAAGQVEDRTALLERHATWYAEHGGRLCKQLDGPDIVSAMDALALERENLFLARKAADPATRLKVYFVLDQLLSVRGPVETQHWLLDEALADAECADGVGGARLLRRRSEVLRMMGRVDEALADVDRSIELARSHGREDLEALGLGSRAFAAWTAGGLEQARVDAEHALDVWSGQGDRVHESLMRTTLGVVCRASGKLEEAEGHYRRALAIQRAVGARRYEGLTLLNLANVRRDRGAREEARELYAQAREVHRALGHLRWEAASLHNLAGLWLSVGEAERAEALMLEALDVARRGGEVAMSAHIQHSVGFTLHFQGEFSEAQAAYAEAAERLQAVDPRAAASARGDLGAVLADQGRLKEAALVLAEAREDLEHVGSEPFLVVLSLHEAHLKLAHARKATDPELAAGYVAEAEAALAGALEGSGARPTMSAMLLKKTLEGAR